MLVEVRYADRSAAIEVDPAKLDVAWHGPAGMATPEVAEAVRRALAEPLGFPGLARAVVPGDVVALAIDDDLPEAREVLAAVARTLGEAGIEPRLDPRRPPDPARRRLGVDPAGRRRRRRPRPGRADRRGLPGDHVDRPPGLPEPRPRRRRPRPADRHAGPGRRRGPDRPLVDLVPRPQRHHDRRGQARRDGRRDRRRGGRGRLAARRPAPARPGPGRRGPVGGDGRDRRRAAGRGHGDPGPRLVDPDPRGARRWSSPGSARRAAPRRSTTWPAACRRPPPSAAAAARSSP